MSEISGYQKCLILTHFNLIEHDVVRVRKHLIRHIRTCCINAEMLKYRNEIVYDITWKSEFVARKHFTILFNYFTII